MISLRILECRRLDVPDKHAKGLLVAHLHQQWANKEAKTLAVANLVVIQAEALEHTAQHLLAFAFRVLEHLDAREASSEVLVDDVLVWTRLATQAVVLVLDQLLSRACCTLPDHAS
jgi:hypothetical protein